MSDSTAASDDTFKLYRYNPSVAIPAIATVLFAIVSVLHFWMMYRARAWFLVPLVLGGVFEVIGFAARAVSASETPNWSLGPYIIQSVFPLVAPALIAGSIYMILGRIILMTDGESHSIIKRKWLTKLFVCGDILAFTVQAGGAGLMSSGSQSSTKTGENIVVTGLFVQLAFFGLFVATALTFHARMRKVPTAQVCSVSMPWQRHLCALYASSVLIMIRSIFRVAEFVTGNMGYLFTHEWSLWVFDALLMLFVLAMFLYVHPGEIRQYLGASKHRSAESQIGLVHLQEYSPPTRDSK